MSKEREETVHPAFGMISFSRTSCGRSPKFFGSSLPVESYIEIKVQQGSIERDLGRDWYHPAHPKKDIVIARMTPSQFSELITTMNIGEGVPCTLEIVNGERVEPLKDFENRAEFHQRKIVEQMQNFSKQLSVSRKRSEELIAKKNLTKEDQKELSWILGSALQEIDKNIPFFLKTFQEGADKIIVEAKAEVENSITNKLMTLGLDAFKDQLRKLEDKKES